MAAECVNVWLAEVSLWVCPAWELGCEGSRCSLLPTFLSLVTHPPHGSMHSLLGKASHPYPPIPASSGSVTPSTRTRSPAPLPPSLAASSKFWPQVQH